MAVLKRLSYSNTFPTTGRTLSNLIDFQEGLGTITGPNEAGKSFIIEMIRFAWFGSAALRGSAADYKRLRCILEFDLRGHTYVVSRAGNNARLLRGDTELAVGVRAVNEKIVNLFGFGLDVFDIACVANQDELQKLGALRPAERKRIVDSVIGLGVLDELSKNAANEALSFTRRADDLEKFLAPPVQPVMPEDYLPSLTWQQEHDRLVGLKSEYDQLKGKLSVQIAEPQRPEDPQFLPIEVLQSLLSDQDELRVALTLARKELGRLPPSSRYTQVDVDRFRAEALKFEQAMQKARFLSQYQEPRYSEADLVAFAEHECPNCGHSWSTGCKDLDLSPAQIEEELRLARRWAAVADQWEVLKSYPDDTSRPRFTPNELAQLEAGIVAEAERKRLASQIKDLDERIKSQPDYGAMVRKVEQFNDAMIRYEADLLRFEKWKTDQGLLRGRAALLEVDIHSLSAVESSLRDARAYEQALVGFKEAKTKFEEVSTHIREFREQAANWTKVRTALTNLRGLVKQHLVPSLNFVASTFLCAMTGGQRQLVMVNEDFEILIDNQPLDTLSGSGKGVANLAIRLALGQVLTNNVLSLFMGDEIDGSFDKDRAENTMQVLNTLRGKISQILLVTHKYPPADYNIPVGTSGDTEQS